MKSLKNKNGSSTIYELLISLMLLTFVVMFPISLFSYLHKINSVNDIMGIAIQSLEHDGRFDEKLYDVINANLKSKGFAQLGDIATYDSKNEHSYILSNVEVSKIENGKVSILNKEGVEIVKSDITYNNASGVSVSNPNETYAKKYRNGFMTSNPNNLQNNIVHYSMSCSCTNKIFYLTKNDIYACPYCGKVNNLETAVEAQVVSLTIYVPVSDQVESMAKLIQLLSYGAIKEEEIENAMGNVQKQTDGNYYFVKTYYGVVEPYYSITNNGF